VGIAIIDADGAGDAIFRALRAPAAAKRTKIADEEFRCCRIDAMELCNQEIGMMPDPEWQVPVP